MQDSRSVIFTKFIYLIFYKWNCDHLDLKIWSRYYASDIIDWMCQKKILPEIISVQWCHFKCVNSFTLLNPCSTDHSLVSPLCLFLPASPPICLSVTKFSQKHLICFFFLIFCMQWPKMRFLMSFEKYFHYVLKSTRRKSIALY